MDEQHLKFVDPASWDQWDSERFVRPGDILWNSTGTGTIGRAALFDGLPSYDRAVVDSHVTIVRSNAAANPRFLFNFIRSPNVQDLIEDMQTGSTNQVELNRGAIVSTTVPLAPLAEQDRIVTKIGGLTGRTARARAELARIPPLVARYKQRLLAQAFAGELTADRAVARSKSVAPMVALRSVCLSLTDGDHQAPPKAPSGIPFITISAMNTGTIDLGKATRMVPKAYFDNVKPARRPKRGDILFSVTGTLGIVALVDFDDDFVFQRHIAILKPDPSIVDARFLSFILSSPQIKEQMSAVATGTAQLTVPLGGLREFRIPLPALDEQLEAVRLLEAAFAWLDRLGADEAAASKLLVKLDAAILVRAFRGELVPQDPNDEPADALLARIRLQGIQQPKKTRSGRPRKRRETTDMPRRLEEVLAEAGEWLPAQEAFRRCGVTNGAQTDDVEPLYAELRALDKAGRLAVEPVLDANGLKLHDRLKLITA